MEYLPERLPSATILVLITCLQVHALGLKLENHNATLTTNLQDDAWTPPGFMPTWTMPGYARYVTDADSHLAALAPVKPASVHGKSVLFLGMANAINGLTHGRITKMMQICSQWLDDNMCHGVIGSASNLPQAVAQLKAAFPGKIEFQNDPPNLPVDRTSKYAVIRNALLETALRKNPTYFIMADLDGAVEFTEPTVGALTTAMSDKFASRWDVTGFVSVRGYYDWWAARCTSSSTNCWADKPTTCFDVSKFNCVPEAEHDSGITFHPVVSAFNGLALYKTSVIGTCRYKGYDENNAADCEHVALNKCINNNNGKITISSMRIDARASTHR